MPLDVELVGVVTVVRRQRPEPVRRQELVFVEELLEEALQPVDADDAEQEAAVAGLTAHQPAVGELPPGRRTRGCHQPGELLADRRRAVDDLLVDDDGGEQRDDADHRPDLHRHLGAVGGDELVVVEAVGLVPHVEVLHRLAHGGEVLEELEHEVRRRALAGAVEDRRRWRAMASA